MQSKGFIRVITACLVLVCIFYLSFSFVSNHYENKAVEFAQAMSKTTDVSNDAYKTYYKSYIDSIANEKVYLNWRTFQEVREMELGLGLDLKGGMNVTLQISVPDILKALSGHNPDAKFNRAIAITDSLHRDEKDYVAAFVSEYKKIGDGSLSQIFRNVEKVKHGMTDDQVAEILKEEVGSMVDNSYNVLRTRIDGFGVVAPNIQKLENTGRILLELPGIKEPERVRKLLQGSANLEFYETYTINELQNQLASLSAAAASASVAPADTTAAPADSAAVAAPKEATRTLADMLWANGQMGGPVIGTVHVQDTAAVNAIMHSAEARRLLPTNLKACWSVKALDEKGRFFNLVALKTNQGRPALGGDVVVDASSDYENLQGNVVSMTMNDTGARQWARVTQQNLNKSVAIVLDDQVYSYPNVNSVIEGGRSQITGNFTPEEAKDLANVLKSGKMAARVNIASESVIGPSLGQESIEAGFWSFIVALVLLVIFMYVGYGFAPGCVANLGLLLNLFFTLGILASFQAVLTLPGIAGIVLTLGTAVDANVLIFERTKEELRAGKGVKAAVADGYKNAFSAIFDSNLTSVITGIILFFNGSGPIKGFATTYIIGIACSFFTAVFATRLVMEWLITKKKFQNMTFSTSVSRRWFQGTNFDFMGNRRKSGMVAGAIVLVAAILLAVRGLSLGIDFSGGRNYVIAFENPVEPEQVRTLLGEAFPGCTSSALALGTDHKTIRVSTNYKIESNSPTVDDEAETILYNALKKANLVSQKSVEDFKNPDIRQGGSIISSSKVGPSVAKDITNGAIISVIIALAAIFLYILVRFRNVAFSIGSTVALALDALVVIGLFSLLQGVLPFSLEVDQTFIGAILTVIGYSINDKVVVFDRIRENLRLHPKQDIQKVFNDSINQTLARTINTSLSTLIVLLCILFLGGKSIQPFAFAMTLGVVFGTLSSIFIASPIAYLVMGRKIKEEVAEA